MHDQCLPRGVAQMVERAVWDREVASSSLAAPTKFDFLFSTSFLEYKYSL